MVQLRELTADEVEFILECEPEDTPIEGNASAIDPETDARIEKWIRDQLDSGNEWAWCAVTVTARWKDFVGMNHLGCCSYRSREDFMACGYFDDLKEVALADLNDAVARCATELEELEI
jgi:hypothetical protein